jgi:hypothetical protein
MNPIITHHLLNTLASFVPVAVNDPRSNAELAQDYINSSGLYGDRRVIGFSCLDDRAAYVIVFAPDVDKQEIVKFRWAKGFR